MDTGMFAEGTTPEEAREAGRSLGEYCVSQYAHPLYRHFAVGFSEGVGPVKVRLTRLAKIGAVLWFVIGIIVALIAIHHG